MRVVPPPAKAGDENHGNSPGSITEFPHPLRAPAGTQVFCRVDTRQHLHGAAVYDKDSSILATEQFPTIRLGYLTLIAWLRGFGDLERARVECTGSYRAALARLFAREGIPVFEVTHPEKGLRRALWVPAVVAVPGLSDDRTGRLGADDGRRFAHGLVGHLVSPLSFAAL